MSWDFYSQREVKTRKPHECDWCGEDIPVGERASYIAGRWDGDFTSGYEHLECLAASQEWTRLNCGWDEGWEPGEGVRGKPWMKDEDEEMRLREAAKGGET